MQNIKLRKPTTELNAIRGPKGLIAYNTDDGSIRCYDGEVLGGWRFEGSPVVFPIPGPSELIAGDSTAGFYGEVASSIFISGTELIQKVGLSSGVVMSEMPIWLKFALDGRVLFIPKIPISRSLSWNNLQSANLLYGDTEVAIFNRTYRVRLIKGANSDPSLNQWDYDSSATHGSEWNRLMYHVSNGEFAQGDGSLASEGITVGDWAQYSEEELGVGSQRPGSLTICQETHGYGAGYYVGRGYRGVSEITYSSKTGISDYRGWRPVLELVE